MQWKAFAHSKVADELAFGKKVCWKLYAASKTVEHLINHASSLCLVQHKPGPDHSCANASPKSDRTFKPPYLAQAVGRIVVGMLGSDREVW